MGYPESNKRLSGDGMIVVVAVVVLIIWCCSGGEPERGNSPILKPGEYGQMKGPGIVASSPSVLGSLSKALAIDDDELRIELGRVETRGDALVVTYAARVKVLAYDGRCYRVRIVSGPLQGADGYVASSYVVR